MTTPLRANADVHHTDGVKRWRCGLCAREIAFPHVKRHLAAHDRRGALRSETDQEWLAFLDVTGWPRRQKGSHDA